MHREQRTIRDLAYQLWEARGRPNGSPERDWLDAERQLVAEAAAAPAGVSRKKSDRREKSRPRTERLER